MRFKSTSLVLSLGLLSLAGCVAEPPPPPPHGPPPPVAPQPQVIIQQAPPPEVVETMPPPPGPPERWVWQRGHYRWDGVAYRWHPGHWVQRPAYATVWIPPHWDQRPGGYIFVEGHWQ